MDKITTVTTVASFASIFSVLVSVVWNVLKFYLAFLAIRFFRHENERYKKEQNKGE